MKYCLNCGEELPKKANFCPNCGVTLENEAKNEPSTLTRAEMYKQRSEEAEEIEEEPQTEEAETNSHSRTQAHAGSEWLSQIKNFVLWVKHNPLVSLLPIVIALVVLIWLNRIVGIGLLVLIVLCGYLYALKVGPADNQAELKLRMGIKKAKNGIANWIQDLKNKKDRKEAEARSDSDVEVEDFEAPEDVLESETMVTDPATSAQAEVKPKPKKMGHPLRSKLLIAGAILLIISTYIGPFASAVVAGYSTPTTLLSILKTLGQQKVLLALLIGPVLIILGAWFRSQWIVKIGSWVNLIAYGYTFYIIYKNEAETSGFPGMFNNVHLGWSGYLAVGITILILAFGRGRKRRKVEQ